MRKIYVRCSMIFPPKIIFFRYLNHMDSSLHAASKCTIRDRLWPYANQESQIHTCATLHSHKAIEKWLEPIFFRLTRKYPKFATLRRTSQEATMPPTPSPNFRMRSTAPDLGVSNQGTTPLLVLHKNIRGHHLGIELHFYSKVLARKSFASGSKAVLSPSYEVVSMRN